MTSSSRAVIATSMAVHTSSLSKLQSLNGIFAIYKKQGPTSADVLNTLKMVILTGKLGVFLMFVNLRASRDSFLAVDVRPLLWGMKLALLQSLSEYFLLCNDFILTQRQVLQIPTLAKGSNI